MDGKDLPANATVAEQLELMADLLEIEGGQSRHRVLAYRRGATRVRATDESVAALALAGRATELADIGGTLQDKIVEFAVSGRIAALDKLRERIPEGLAEVAHLEGIGPKRARAIWDELGVTDRAGLASAATDGRLAKVAGIGPKTVASLADQLAADPTGEAGRVRIPIGRALPIARRLVDELSATPGVERIEIAGGLRRGAETVHDIDIAVATTDRAAFVESLRDSALVAETLAGGPAGTAVMTHAGIRAEFRFTEVDAFGNLLQHLTGSKAHNIRLRELAVRQGLSISEHGVTDADGGVVTSADENEIYAQLGLSPIPAELREDSGEIAVAATGTIPPLVTEADLRGDLHVHTTWSDGRDSLADMVRAAAALGLEYLAISDHSRALAMAGGLDAERVRAQWAEIDAINASGAGVTVLKACEVDVLADGTLDHDDELLAGFDWVTASLHSGFRQSRERLTSRLLAAIAHPSVNAIGHPTGRMFGRRDAYPVDLDRVIAAAVEHGTALEINAQPRRLDLNAQMARQALAGGAWLVIGSDAHSVAELAVRSYGVLTARRAGATKERIVNCLPLTRLRELRAAAR